MFVSWLLNAWPEARPRYAQAVARVAHIFRWDLDKTYLKTEFDSVGDIVKVARSSAEERENIPGSAALVKSLRECQGDEFARGIYFISGSPEQLRSVIEKKFEIDGIKPDGFTLKPTVSNFFRGRFRAVRGQVGYKLARLLQARSEAPIGTPESLFGDDAENDAYIYSLYADLVAGKIERKLLKKILKKAGVYSDQVSEIEAAMDAIVHEDPVRRIIIHLDQKTPPVAFLPFFPRVVPIYSHLQTAVVLRMDGSLATSGIKQVARELIATYQVPENQLANLAEDILRRRRGYHAPELLNEIAEDLKEAAETTEISSEDSFNPEVEARLKGLLLQVAERTEHLRHRPLASAPRKATETIDYLGLWTEEEARKEDLRRAKKYAARAAKK